MKNYVKSLIIGGPLENALRWLLRKPKLEFRSTPEYWELRYKLKGNSGSGSYGRLADYKANCINGFVKNNEIKSVIEFGCGDGNQLTLAQYNSYIGLDISNKAIKIC